MKLPVLKAQGKRIAGMLPIQMGKYRCQGKTAVKAAPLPLDFPSVSGGGQVIRQIHDVRRTVISQPGTPKIPAMVEADAVQDVRFPRPDFLQKGRAQSAVAAAFTAAAVDRLADVVQKRTHGGL